MSDRIFPRSAPRQCRDGETIPDSPSSLDRFPRNRIRIAALSPVQSANAPSRKNLSGGPESLSCDWRSEWRIGELLESGSMLPQFRFQENAILRTQQVASPQNEIRQNLGWMFLGMFYWMFLDVL